MFNFVSVYPAIVRQAVEDVHPNNSFLSNLHTHKVSTYRLVHMYHVDCLCIVDFIKV